MIQKRCFIINSTAWNIFAAIFVAVGAGSGFALSSGNYIPQNLINPFAFNIHDNDTLFNGKGEKENCHDLNSGICKTNWF